jgi:uncharacterized integral membrane protein
MGIRQFVVRVWSHRRAMLLVAVLLVLLWFVVSNWERSRIAFPFGVSIEAPLGFIVIASAALGALAGVLVLSLYRTFR